MFYLKWNAYIWRKENLLVSLNLVQYHKIANCLIRSMTGYIQVFYIFLNEKAKTVICRKRNLPFQFFDYFMNFGHLWSSFMYFLVYYLWRCASFVVYVPFATPRRVLVLFLFYLFFLKRCNPIVEIAKTGLLCSCHKQITNFFFFWLSRLRFF